jgi:hypothetical protein
MAACCQPSVSRERVGFFRCMQIAYEHPITKVRICMLRMELFMTYNIVPLCR